MNKSLMGLIAILAITSALTVNAARITVTDTVVTRILTTSEVYGTCMAQLSKTLANSGLDCPSSWVTFACDGAFEQKKDVAYKMFEAAQMSLLLGTRLNVRVDDFKKINGYCVADEVYSYNPLPSP